MINLTGHKVFIHSVAHPKAGEGCDCLKDQKELGIKWPDAPFKCPACDHIYETHAHTCALVDVAAVAKAKKVVGLLTTILEEGKEDGKPLQAAQRARYELIKVSAAKLVENPADFLCTACVVTAAQAHANPVPSILLDLLRPH